MASSNEVRKRKFRKTKRWLEWRNYISNKYNHRDPISDKPLRKGYSVHHLIIDKDRYEELDEENFIPLNKQMHDTIHVCYNYAKSDKNFMNRLVYWVNTMLKLNKK